MTHESRRLSPASLRTAAHGAGSERAQHLAAQDTAADEINSSDAAPGGDGAGAQETDTDALLRRVVSLVAEHNLAELTVEQDGLHISVRGLGSPANAEAAVMLHPQMLTLAQSPLISQTPVLSAAAADTPPSATPGAVRIAQESPMVGVYYRAATPEDPPFVSVGDKITIGQPIGLIEAMKVYSELPSEVAGRVVEIAAQNGKLVQQGQPILFVEPL